MIMDLTICPFICLRFGPWPSYPLPPPPPPPPQPRGTPPPPPPQPAAPRAGGSVRRDVSSSAAPSVFRIVAAWSARRRPVALDVDVVLAVRKHVEPRVRDVLGEPSIGVFAVRPRPRPPPTTTAETPPPPASVVSAPPGRGVCRADHRRACVSSSTRQLPARVPPPRTRRERRGRRRRGVGRWEQRGGAPARVHRRHDRILLAAEHECRAAQRLGLLHVDVAARGEDGLRVRGVS